MNHSKHPIILILLVLIIFSSSTTFAQDTSNQSFVQYKMNYLPVDPPEPFYVDTQNMYITDKVVDSYLQYKLDDSQENDRFEIIVQFKGSVFPNDIQILENLGFEIIREYNVVPGLHCMGTKSATQALAKNERVFWIEYNEQLEYYMQGTTTVINATKTWNSDILNSDGQNFGRIDGMGITVVVLDLESSGLSSSTGDVWVFNIRGYGFVFPVINFIKENQYYEARIPYTASAVLILDQTGTYNTSIDFENLHAIFGQWEFSEPSNGYSNGTITMDRYFFDLANVQPLMVPPTIKEEKEEVFWPWLLLAVLILLLLALYLIMRRRKRQKNED